MEEIASTLPRNDNATCDTWFIVDLAFGGKHALGVLVGLSSSQWLASKQLKWSAFATIVLLIYPRLFYSQEYNGPHYNTIITSLVQLHCEGMLGKERRSSKLWHVHECPSY